MAIQKIINKEFGAQNSENLLQGSFFLEYLTDRVEEAVLLEFDSLARRGGVLAAMEMQYQRSKIQEESLYYEYLKDSGELPIVGVNTFVNQEGNTNEIASQPLTRASYEDKKEQIRRKENFQMRNKNKKEEALRKLKNAVIGEKNIFEELMDTVHSCSLGEITQALYEVGGRYRRSM
jgi:methylmalonyl-CoA mutase